MAQDEQGIEALIRQARANPDALGTLLERYRSFLQLVAERQTKPWGDGNCDASGIVQQTLIEAVQGFGRFGGSGEPQFSAWITQIHRNNILDALRRIHPHVTLPATRDESASLPWNEPAAVQTSPSQRIIRGETALRVAQLIEALPEMQRRAVKLRHFECWPVERIAQHLNRTVPAVAGLLKRGLHRVREGMSEESCN